MKKKVLISSAVFVSILTAMFCWQQRSEAIPSSTRFNVRVIGVVWENFSTTRDKTLIRGTGLVVVGKERAIVKFPDLIDGADQISFDLADLETSYKGNLYTGTGSVDATIRGTDYTFNVKTTLRLQKRRDHRFVATLFIAGGNVGPANQTLFRTRARGISHVGPSY